MEEEKKRNTTRQIVTPIAVALLLLAGIFIGRMSVSRQVPRATSTVSGQSVNADNNKLVRTLDLINEQYVDHLSLDSITEQTLPELMSHLDPHSVYIPATAMGDANEQLDGEFDGIGVVFNMATDTVVVLNVIRGGPSYKAGIQAGDRIVIVGSDTVAGRSLPQNDVVKKLRGRRGTKVKVMIERNEVEGLVPVEIVRDKIPISSIDASFMLRPEIGFVKLSAFARTSNRELTEALAELKKQGMKSLIFDLRDNLGGFLDQAIDIANQFLEEGQLVVFTADRNGNRVEEHCHTTGKYSDIKLVVLINEYSASSSEILAGALQDNDHGTVVGRRSFGKGLVQRQIEFTDGSAIRLTVARYYTPTGRSIQKPYTLGSNDYDNDIDDRYEHNEFFSADSIKFADSLKFVTKGGKVVYGGGGIMPDVFVPVDTTGSTYYLASVIGRNILYRYTLDYTDRHRQQINRIKTIEQLQAFLDSDKRLVDDFVDYAERHKVERNAEQIARSREIIESQIRAYVGRNTELEDVGFYVNIFPIDATLKRAVEILEQE